jgi:hypothetical protein
MGTTGIGAGSWPFAPDDPGGSTTADGRSCWLLLFSREGLRGTTPAIAILHGRTFFFILCRCCCRSLSRASSACEKVCDFLRLAIRALIFAMVPGGDCDLALLALPRNSVLICDIRSYWSNAKNSSLWPSETWSVARSLLDPSGGNNHRSSAGGRPCLSKGQRHVSTIPCPRPLLFLLEGHGVLGLVFLCLPCR